jgi:hypothetical protein
MLSYQLTSRILRAPRSLAGHHYHLEPGTIVHHVKECSANGNLIVSTVENPEHRIPSEDLFEVFDWQVSLLIS